jgi:glyoxylase-like metal-dependent hydrolase (beta-lactamase superfamily II)
MLGACGPIKTDNAADSFPQPEAARGPLVPPEKGYLVEEIRDGVYWLTQGHYQMMFLTTGEGVIVVDAPRALAAMIKPAIAEVTAEPITHLIYSHFHSDHIGAAAQISAGATIIAQHKTLRLLAEAADPKRPLPTVTFDDKFELKVGHQTLELSYTGPNHDVGNIMIYAPKQKVLMMVDVVWAGWVPFGYVGLADHIPGVMRSMDDLLEYDFDTFIGGHANRLGNRGSVETQKEYMRDVQNAVREALNEVDFSEYISTIGWDRRWEMFSTYYKKLAAVCAAKVVPKWSARLGGVASFTPANCEAVAFSQYVD